MLQRRLGAIAGLFMAICATAAGAQTQPPPAAGAQALDIGDCPDTAGTFEDGNTYACACPPASSGMVYGTDVYTYDSNICQSAIHAGALKKGAAGRVSVRVIASPRVFKGTTRNGIKSQVWVTPTPHAFEIAPAQ